MKKRPLETVMGIVVILAALGFIVFAYSKIELKAVEGYNIYALFQQAGGLENGSNVEISGIKVGTVTARELDDDFNAKVSMVIKEDVALPDDTVAVVMGDGLMGGKLVNLIPGKSHNMLKDGGKITRVKDFKSLEDSVSEIIFLATKGPKDAE
jgi:phospholipid/cholesterol/gamma-HCH transport system substrate-binding protein